MPPDVRFNDGACDPAGRFWAGTAATDGQTGTGSLYRLDPDGSVTEVFGGVTESNGLGWSPDGTDLLLHRLGRGPVPGPGVRASTWPAGSWPASAT